MRIVYGHLHIVGASFIESLMYTIHTGSKQDIFCKETTYIIVCIYLFNAIAFIYS
jgi:hypothetical protein